MRQEAGARAGAWAVSLIGGAGAADPAVRRSRAQGRGRRVGRAARRFARRLQEGNRHAAPAAGEDPAGRGDRPVARGRYRSPPDDRAARIDDPHGGGAPHVGERCVAVRARRRNRPCTGADRAGHAAGARCQPDQAAGASARAHRAGAQESGQAAAQLHRVGDLQDRRHDQAAACWRAGSGEGGGRAGQGFDRCRRTLRSRRWRTIASSCARTCCRGRPARGCSAKRTTTTC